MALFGYPKAQENDAERAARAGLAILRALEDLNAKNVARGLPALAARIGLQSGPVVVDSSGEVFGDAPNVAARVQAAAEPGTLFVTALVQRQVAGLFVAEDKGPHELKGVPGKPVLYRLVRASGGGRKAGARSLTPLVGREEELAALVRRWERAKAGEGQFVQIVGEPGLGKSRLMEEFRIRLAETPHTWVEWSSSQLLQNTPLHPLAEWGRQRFAGEAKLRRTRSGAGAGEARSRRACAAAGAAARHPDARRARAETRGGGAAPAGSLRRWSLGYWPARARNRSCSRSRICIGRTRRRSI